MYLSACLSVCFICPFIYLFIINYLICLSRVGCIDVGIIHIIGIHSSIFSLSAGTRQISNHYFLKLVTKKPQIIQLDLVFFGLVGFLI